MSDKTSLFDAACNLLGPIAAHYGEMRNIGEKTYPVPVSALKDLERAYRLEFDRRERAAENKAKREDLFNRVKSEGGKG